MDVFTKSHNFEVKTQVMANIYEMRSYGKLLFILAAIAVAAMFLYVSDNLINDLARQERDRMEIWADATREIINSAATETTDSAAMAAMSNNFDFLLSIIGRNTTIPVLLTDDNGNILQHRNFDLPEPNDGISPLSPRNEKYLKDKLAHLSHSTNVIRIDIAPGVEQRLYYEDSTLLKRLSYYPYIELIVMIAFVIVVYYAVVSSKRAEQNKVWVGLSKETAHQLGTPISSLMGWLEVLPDYGVDDDTVAEMSKDVERLSTIASRFSKIGSAPQMEAADLNDIASHAVDYMRTRISSNVKLTLTLAQQNAPVMACVPLIEWVLENLIKNAVDAMEAHGTLDVITKVERDMAIIDVTDSGKGISRKNFKTVFNPGYTTKKRGWGLGLTLAKRIVEQYHNGRIYVASSAPGRGTTFRVEIPLNLSQRDEL